jgi:hypothetical protein
MPLLMKTRSPRLRDKPPHSQIVNFHVQTVLKENTEIGFVCNCNDMMLL